MDESIRRRSDDGHRYEGSKLVDLLATKAGSSGGKRNNANVISVDDRTCVPRSEKSVPPDLCEATSRVDRIRSLENLTTVTAVHFVGRPFLYFVPFRTSVTIRFPEKPFHPLTLTVS